MADNKFKAGDKVTIDPYKFSVGPDEAKSWFPKAFYTVYDHPANGLYVRSEGPGSCDWPLSKHAHRFRPYVEPKEEAVAEHKFKVGGKVTVNFDAFVDPEAAQDWFKKPLYEVMEMEGTLFITDDEDSNWGLHEVENGFLPYVEPKEETMTESNPASKARAWARWLAEQAETLPDNEIVESLRVFLQGYDAGYSAGWDAARKKDSLHETFIPKFPDRSGGCSRVYSSPSRIYLPDR